METKSVTKFQMQTMVEMSRSTLQRYFRSRRDALREMGVNPYAKVLPPKAVHHILRDLGYE